MDYVLKPLFPGVAQASVGTSGHRRMYCRVPMIRTEEGSSQSRRTEDPANRGDPIQAIQGSAAVVAIQPAWRLMVE